MEKNHRASPLVAALLALGLALLAGLVHAPALHNGFAGLDDSLYVFDNPNVLGGLTWRGMQWAFSLHTNSYWHPLTWLSLMLDAQVFGSGAWGFHLTNVALHAANVALFFWLLRLASGRAWPSAAAAALFAVHPMHVEAVAWITARKDVLSAFFFLASATAYASWAKNRRHDLRILSIACFSLAVLAKPASLVLPFALLLLDAWPLQRLPLHAPRQIVPVVMEKLPYFAISALVLVMVSISHPLAGTDGYTGNVPLLLRLKNIPMEYALYLRKLVWPGDLAVFYSFPLAIPAWKWLGALILLAALTAAGVLLARTKPALTAGWAFFLGTLIPMLGLVQTGLWPALADRYAYLPYLGLYMALCFGLADLPPARLPRPLLAAGLAAVLTALIPVTWAQSARWGDTEALFRQATVNAQDNWMAFTLLGQNLAAQNRLVEAERAYRTSLELNPQNGATYSALGVTLENQGRLQEALDIHREAIRRNPNHSTGYANLGWALMRKGILNDETEQAFRKAMALAPGQAYPHMGMAQFLLQRGETDAAAQEFRTALELQPGIPGARLGLGQVLMRKRDYAAALDEFTKELPNSPEDIELLAGLGFALAHLRRYAEALPHFMAVARLRPNAAASWYNLGVVQARAGELDRARQSLERALILAPDFNRARDALDNLPTKPGNSTPSQP